MIFTFLYCATSITCLLGLQVSYYVNHKTVMDRLAQFFLLTLLVHICHAAIFRDLLPGLIYVDRSAPFGLMYGPFLYFAYRAIEQKAITAKQVLLHGLPFLIGLIGHFVFISSYSFRMEYRSEYYLVLYSLMGLSWFFYPVGVFIISNNGANRARLERRIYYYSVILILVSSIFMLTLVLNRMMEKGSADAPSSGATIFFIMLLGSLLGYNYLLGRLRKPLRLEMQSFTGDLNVDPFERNLTGLTYAEQQGIKLKIIDYLVEKSYLDTEFSIDKMSKLLNVSKPVIQQFFKLHFNDSFLKVINALRIKEACIYLSDEAFDMNIEELALHCGFNSRASFYRNFNQEMGCSPIEFREKSVMK